MKFIKKNLSKFIPFLYLIITPVSVILAADPQRDSGSGGKIIDPLNGKYSNIPALIKDVLQGAIKIGVPIVALAIIYCGFLFVAARGNSEKITKARDALFYTLIGAAILLGSWAIANLIDATVKGIS